MRRSGKRKRRASCQLAQAPGCVLSTREIVPAAATSKLLSLRLCAWAILPQPAMGREASAASQVRRRGGESALLSQLDDDVVHQQRVAGLIARQLPGLSPDELERSRLLIRESLQKRRDIRGLGQRLVERAPFVRYRNRPQIEPLGEGIGQ